MRGRARRDCGRRPTARAPETGAAPAVPPSAQGVVGRREWTPSTNAAADGPRRYIGTRRYRSHGRPVSLLRSPHRRRRRLKLPPNTLVHDVLHTHTRRPTHGTHINPQPPTPNPPEGSSPAGRGPNARRCSVRVASARHGRTSFTAVSPTGTKSFHFRKYFL